MNLSIVMGKEGLFEFWRKQLDGNEEYTKQVDEGHDYERPQSKQRYRVKILGNGHLRNSDMFCLFIYMRTDTSESFWLLCYWLVIPAFVFQTYATDDTTDMEEDLKVLVKADPDRQQSLQTEVIPDPMEGEQTWPTEEELNEANGW